MNKNEHIVISPKDFIRPPYIKCPKCGKNLFGILMIGDHHYTRRCAECYYPKGQEKAVSYPLPDLDKKIIYIDQFAISNMMKSLNPDTNSHKKSTIDRFWDNLFKELDTLCKLQLIVCPESDFHRNESALFFEAELKRMYEFLSQGVSFNPHKYIERHQIITSLKIWLKKVNNHDIDIHKVTHGTINAWQERYYISLNTKYSPESIEELKSNRNKIAEVLKGLFSIWQSEKGNDFHFWYDREKKAYAEVLVQKHTDWYKKSILMMSGQISYRFEDLNPPSAVTIINMVKERLSENGIKEKDLSHKLSEFLQSKVFEDTPFNKISAMMYAILAKRVSLGRKKLPTKGFVTDVDIISTLLPYCNAMFVDNEIRGFLLESPLCDEIKRYKTKIFSKSNKDEFLSYLDNIKSQASKEHLMAVREVYGPNWENPFVEMYNSGITP